MRQNRRAAEVPTAPLEAPNPYPIFPHVPGPRGRVRVWTESGSREVGESGSSWQDGETARTSVGEGSRGRGEASSVFFPLSRRRLPLRERSNRLPLRRSRYPLREAVAQAAEALPRVEAL